MSALPAVTGQVVAALAAARHAVQRRRPVWLDGDCVGSVAEANLPLLAAHPADFAVAEAGVEIRMPTAEREPRLAALHRQWHADGVITGWRDEAYALSPLHGPEAGQPRVAIERAASRFWGSLTFGAHANGYLRGADGRPAALWIAQRSASKPTDPGLFDNLVGGGVPLHQQPAEALVREAWEEAGLPPGQARHARAGRVLHLARDLPEGFQREWLFAFDIELPASFVPQNQDGEVQAFRLLPIADALALAQGDTMTVDAALVTLDFADRHGLLPPALQAAFRSFLAGQN